LGGGSATASFSGNIMSRGRWLRHRFDFFTNASKSLTGKCRLLALVVAIFVPQSMNYSP
jgi:hypothetical protein